MSKKQEIPHRFESSDRAEVVSTFEADRAEMRAKGYVPVEERWSEPGGEEKDVRLETTLLNQSPGVVTTHLGVGEARVGTERTHPFYRRVHRLEVRYAPVEQAAKSQGGLLDITVTKNGRCPTCDLPTMQMPRPPYERYCNACKAEFPA